MEASLSFRARQRASVGRALAVRRTELDRGFATSWISDELARRAGRPLDTFEREAVESLFVQEAADAERYGIPCAAARDGWEALEILAATEPDLILVDW